MARILVAPAARADLDQFINVLKLPEIGSRRRRISMQVSVSSR
jgi:hypothetical protein